MKSLFKLGVILIGFAIFGYAEVRGADWKYLSETSLGTLFYDVESITRPAKNIVRVWSKLVYSEKGRNYMVEKFGSHHENKEYTFDLWEFNCSDKMIRPLSSIAYSKNGEVLESFNYDVSKWDFLPPGSIKEMLSKAVCK